MDRSQIQQQAAVGPSSARARAVDTFQQARVDTEGSDRLRRLSDALGLGARFSGQMIEQQNQQELEDAQREIDEGIVQGMIDDGSEIRQGNMDAVDSPFFRRGLEIGRARASGLEIGMRLDERRRTAILNGEPIPTDVDEYLEWREAQIAEISEEMGVDTNSLSPMAAREYANSLNEIRQQDGARQRSYANEVMTEEAFGQVETEVLSIWQGAEDTAGAIEATRELLNERYATGLDGTRLKQTAVDSVIAQANRTGNADLLDAYRENNDLINPALDLRLTDESRQIRDRVSRERARRIQEAQDEFDRREDAILLDWTRQVYANPYQEIPPEVVQMGDETVTRAQRVQNALISNRDNSVNPVSSAAYLDSVYGLARQDGAGPLARNQLDRLHENGLISNDQFVEASGRIRSYEENAGTMNSPIINRIRGDLTIDAGISGMGGDALARLEIDRRMTFDTLVLEGLDEWRVEAAAAAQQNGLPPPQVVPQAVQIRIANEARELVLNASEVDRYSSLNGTDPQREALRGLRNGGQESDEGGDGTGTPPPRERPF